MALRVDFLVARGRRVVGRLVLDDRVMRTVGPLSPREAKAFRERVERCRHDVGSALLACADWPAYRAGRPVG